MIKASYGFVARRGMHSIKQNIPENSIGAFKLAIQNRFAIHFEVQLSFDNEALVFGDDDFRRLCSLDMKPRDCYIDEASRLMLNGTDYRVLTLKQALQAIGGEVPVLIEIIEHSDDEIGTLEEKVVQALNNYNGVIAVASKNPMVVMWFKTHYPNLERGLIEEGNQHEGLAGMFQKVLQKTQAVNFACSPNFICYNLDNLSESYALDCRKKNIPILGYTARTEEQLKKARKLCDGIIFEEISVTDYTE